MAAYANQAKEYYGQELQALILYQAVIISAYIKLLNIIKCNTNRNLPLMGED